MNELEVRELDEEALASFARLVPVDGSPDIPAEKMSAALNVVRAEFGPEVESRVIDAGQAGSSVDVLEIHHRSPQLTIAFDADWILTILTTATEPRKATPRDLVAYSVPAGAAILLRKGVWHGPVAPTAPTRVALTFTSDAPAHSEVVELAAPFVVSR